MRKWPKVGMPDDRWSVEDDNSAGPPASVGTGKAAPRYIVYRLEVIQSCGLEIQSSSFFTRGGRKAVGVRLSDRPGRVRVD